MHAFELGAWSITGTAVLTDRAKIAALAGSITKSILHNRLEVASCFLPRHAIRFQRGSEQVTLLVCFECLQVDVDGLREREKEPYFHIAVWSGAPRIWNDIFEGAGLKIGFDRSLRLSKSPTWKTDYPSGFFADLGSVDGPRHPSVPASGGSIQIEVRGSVRAPGRYTLGMGSTLIDAVVAAGGMRKSGIRGSGYGLWVAQSGKPPIDQEYSFDAQEGASRLGRYALQPGDVISTE